MEFCLEHFLETSVKAAAKDLPIIKEDFNPEIRPADERFGDFQANGLLAYCGRLRENPREWAQALKESFEAQNTLWDVSVAGPGFLNFKLKDKALLEWLENFHSEVAYRTHYTSTFSGRTVVIDYSSPNSAKRMHVGHLRSMVIGEALQRLIRFGGGQIIRDNHLGDWGTQFGILLMQIKETRYKFDESPEAAIETLESLYQSGNARVKEDVKFLERAHQELVRLQQGDPKNVALWKRINEISYASFENIYKRMGVTFDYVLGESFYRDKVQAVYEALQAHQLAVEDAGALVVFHPEHPRFCKQPFLIRKSDGASNYASTDLATALYRVQTFYADDIIYVTDCRQSDHFEQLFLTVKKWFQAVHQPLPNLYHVTFGTVLDAQGKAIKTREGKPIQLQDLLNKAVERARNLIDEKSSNLSEKEKQHVAEVVGLGAIKYADLAQERTSNYCFSWDKMIQFEGNTAPYLLYAIARIYAIFRKMSIDVNALPQDAWSDIQSFSTDTERALAHKLIAFPSTLNLTLHELKPHWLCRYLFELAGAFSSFYNSDKVAIEDVQIKQTRLLLCGATLATLETGLHLLGLDTLKRM